MDAKFFVGLTFYADTTFARNIQSFRTRYDDKYTSNPILHLPLVAPFEIPAENAREMELEIQEELESFFFGHLMGHALKFTGIDVHEYGRKKFIYLNPAANADLDYCCETLTSICHSYIAGHDKNGKLSKNFLTVGRFTDLDLFHAAMSVAQTEYHHFTELPFKSICLFKKQYGIWYQQTELIRFERAEESFLHSRTASL